MMNKNRIAYAEVYSFINSLPAKEYKRIPNNVVDYINWHRDYNYEFNYDCTKTVDEQNFSKEAVTMIMKLYLEYFADKYERQKVNSIIYKNDLKKNEELMKKYNPDDLFKNNTTAEIIETDNKEETSLVDSKKDSFFTIIKNFIKNVLHRKS